MANATVNLNKCNHCSGSFNDVKAHRFLAVPCAWLNNLAVDIMVSITCPGCNHENTIQVSEDKTHLTLESFLSQFDV